MQTSNDKISNDKVAIVNLGTELVQGFTPDTNAFWMAGRLRDLGFSVAYEITLPDSADVWNCTVEMIRKAGVGIILVGGGLGPTEDDRTRNLVAEAFDAPLEFHPDVFETIRAFLESRGLNCADTNRIQAFFPRGAKILDNPVGTAPGFRLTSGDVTLFSMPGVPFEAKTMFCRHVEPFLREKNVARPHFRELRIAGISESNMAEAFSRVEFPPTVSWSSLPEKDCIVFRIYTKESCEVLDSLAQTLTKSLPDPHDLISSDGKSLTETVAALLESLGETLATAESCTGGMIASEIVNLPGASRVFKGGACTYWNEAKEEILKVPHDILEKFGAVSEETAIAMAEGAKKIYQSDWAVATTGVAGPDGGTPEKPVGMVWMAVAGPNQTVAFCKKFSGNRTEIRQRSVFKVQDSLRRLLIQKIEQKSTCTKVQ